MGYHLVSVGWFLIGAGILSFILGQVGPNSRLWWPDRPNDRRTQKLQTVLPAFILVIGIALVVLGALAS